MNRTNCAPGGKACQAGRSPAQRFELGRAAGLAGAMCACLRCTKEARSAIGRKGGTISQSLKTAEERTAAARHAAAARWAKV